MVCFIYYDTKVGIIFYTCNMVEVLVNGVIAQYLSIEGATNMAQRYNELYERSVVNMRNRLNAQKKPIRRRYRMF